MGVSMSALSVCCLPPVLHPVSLFFLQQYLEGSMTTEWFMRVFSLPNSDYIPYIYCIVEVVTGG
jgi:hypothetical protein